MFTIVSISASIVQAGTFAIMNELCKCNYWLSYLILIVTMLSNFVLEFLYTRYVVHRNSCDTAFKNKTT